MGLHHTRKITTPRDLSRLPHIHRRRRSKSHSTPQPSKTEPASSSKPSEKTTKTQKSRKHAPHAPRKPNRSNSKNSKKNATSNATMFSDKPYTHILIWWMPPLKESSLTSFDNASMNTQHPSRHTRKAVGSQQKSTPSSLKNFCC